LTQAHDGPEDDKLMPLLDHLTELRKADLCLVSFFAVFFVTFYFAPIFVPDPAGAGRRLRSSFSTSSSSSSP
jgi:hypothetical protein